MIPTLPGPIKDKSALAIGLRPPWTALNPNDRNWGNVKLDREPFR